MAIRSATPAWPRSTAEARALQESLRGHVVAEDRLGPIRSVAGLDAAYGSGGSAASEQQVRGMLGVADAGGVFDLFEAVMAGRTEAALTDLRSLYDSGADPITAFKEARNVLGSR